MPFCFHCYHTGPLPPPSLDWIITKVSSVFSLLRPLPTADSCLLSLPSSSANLCSTQQSMEFSVFTDIVTGSETFKSFTLQKHKQLKIQCKDTLFLKLPHHFLLLGSILPPLALLTASPVLSPFSFSPRVPVLSLQIFYSWNLNNNESWVYKSIHSYIPKYSNNHRPTDNSPAHQEAHLSSFHPLPCYLLTVWV